MIVTADGMGLITIEWWQLAVIGGGVFLAVLIADRISSYLDVRREQRQDTEHGPYPCLVHLGTEVDGYEWWCWRQHGHEGGHLNQWGVDPSQDLAEPVTIAEVAAEMGDTDTITIVDHPASQGGGIPETCAQYGCGPDYCPGGLQCRGDMLRKIGE